MRYRQVAEEDSAETFERMRAERSKLGRTQAEAEIYGVLMLASSLFAAAALVMVFFMPEVVELWSFRWMLLALPVMSLFLHILFYLQKGNERDEIKKLWVEFMQSGVIESETKEAQFSASGASRGGYQGNLSGSLSKAKHNIFQAKRDRLLREVEQLRRRGNVNLAIGAIATFTAITALVWLFLVSPLETSDNTTALDMFNYYLPRFSLAIFIELFGFFFLRLYRTSLSDIRYYQNELTIIESRYLALLVALEDGSEGLVGGVVERLASIERAQVLGKGQTTVEIEQSKIDALKTNSPSQQSESLLKGVLLKR